MKGEGGQYAQASAKREEIKNKEEAKKLAIQARIQARENWRGERKVGRVGMEGGGGRKKDADKRNRPKCRT